MPVFLLHVGQLLNVSLPVAIYSVALPGLSSCLTLLLELTFAGFLPATIHLLDVLLLTYSSNPLRIFMAKLDPPSHNINGIAPNVGWKLHFEPINNNPETFEAIQSHLRDNAKVDFKGGTSGYGNLDSEGKTYTAYPRSLEERDRVIASMRDKDTGISHLLAPVTPVEGNAQFTDNITGRFTTGYTYADPLTGEIDWGRGDSFGAENRASVAAARRGEANNYVKDSWNSPYEKSEMGFFTETEKKGFRVSHEEIAEDIASLKMNHPAVHELMVGKPGYNSPYPVHLPGVNSALDLNNLREMLNIDVNAAPANTLTSSNPSADLLIETMKQERIETSRLAEEALPGTRAAMEKEGYLYHYAPKSKRDLIAKQGIIGNQAATAAQGPGKAFFFLDPEGHSLAQFAPSETDLDLYRVKTTSEMLDQLKVDDHLPLKGGIGQSVYLEGDIAQKGIQAELMADKIDTTSGKIVSKTLNIGSPTEIRTSVDAPTRMPIQKAATATEARIASSVAIETVEEGIGKVVKRSGSSSRLLSAAAEASAAVAGGKGKSGLLRATAAAATILGVADISRRRHNNPYKKE